MFHAGSMGRVLTASLRGVSPVVHTNPSEVLFCACSEAETCYYVSWFSRGEGMSIWPLDSPGPH